MNRSPPEGVLLFLFGVIVLRDGDLPGVLLDPCAFLSGVFLLFVLVYWLYETDNFDVFIEVLLRTLADNETSAFLIHLGAWPRFKSPSIIKRF